ncbi:MULTISPECIES: protein phosphatase 2C domain-containing protein [Pseudanabaena]|uniref:Protein serine/threonine phosphatase n=2 Tax=Pseudanabaena TaxID=1152 RepID=L8MZL2_9CYAN|nr:MULTISPECIES: protein phosphatase 2C domain-containing protein [Pseudanabaena]ELS33407.1 protein serine/threonine phosphatase [Pseudanabaena biceps PCC 7429]MDG3494388.1 protein phosphatase 2C domain-containing protein [Pseudanabaena catenata USMAC16]
MEKQEQATAVEQQYLWAVGLDTDTFPPDSLVADRYHVLSSQIVVDTDAYSLPELPLEFQTYVVSYLKLSRLSLHLPRPYGLLLLGEELNLSEVFLLENVPIDRQGKLCPTLAEAWAEASALRQINLLWQVLNLWQPLAEQNMTRTLIDPRLVRVDGMWVRLLELQADVAAVHISQLGDIWVQWLDLAKPEIAEPIAEFFYSLGRGEYDINGAIAHLDRMALNVMENQPLNVRIASATDVGIQRADKGNEDACYPDAKRQKRTEQPEALRDRLAIVCDGLGGHDGGEVASSLAIKTLEQQLKTLLQQAETDPDFSAQGFIAQLEMVARVVNNQIVAINDQQQRQAQKRMGTTLVMAVMPRPNGKMSNEVYVMHIGDSRLYCITKDSLRQVTLDDDVATRETTLGYNFYAYSSQRIDGGALIQALGTRGSDMLVPRVQRFFIDEDCLLLLCSDGLSDFDRVEQIRDRYLFPILSENQSLDRGCQNLIDQANQLNGHDNITVALMRCRFAPEDVEQDLVNENQITTEVINPSPEADTEDIQAESEEAAGALALTSSSKSESAEDPDFDLDEFESAKTELAVPKQTNSAFIIILILVALILGSGLAAMQFPQVKNWVRQHLPTSLQKFAP